jgi:hypothetical protein
VHLDPIHKQAYTRNLETVLYQVRNEWGFQGTIVWVSASAPIPQMQEQNFKAYKHFQTFAKCRCSDSQLTRLTKG